MGAGCATCSLPRRALGSGSGDSGDSPLRNVADKWKLRVRRGRKESHFDERRKRVEVVLHAGRACGALREPWRTTLRRARTAPSNEERKSIVVTISKVALLTIHFRRLDLLVNKKLEDVRELKCFQSPTALQLGS